MFHAKGQHVCTQVLRSNDEQIAGIDSEDRRRYASFQTSCLDFDRYRTLALDHPTSLESGDSAKSHGLRLLSLPPPFHHCCCRQNEDRNSYTNAARQFVPSIPPRSQSFTPLLPAKTRPTHSSPTTIQPPSRRKSKKNSCSVELMNRNSRRWGSNPRP